MKEEHDLFDEMEGLIVSEARKTYSEMVIDHFLKPRNIGTMDDADCFTMMSGICGDTIGIFVKLDRDRIVRVSFVSNGCGPTIACGSALTCMAKGMTLEAAAGISGSDLIAYLDGLPKEHTHCADLAVNTLKGALAKAEN